MAPFEATGVVHSAVAPSSRISASLIRSQDTVLLDAGNISAMPALNGRTIVAGLVVSRVSVGKTVGHHQIKHVGRREALMRVCIARALGQWKGAARLALIVSGRHPQGLRRGVADLQPQESPVAVLRSLSAVKSYAVAAQSEARSIQALAMHQ